MTSVSKRSFWERRVLPSLIDRVCSDPEVAARRAEWVARARGTILELGIGSGLNFDHYDREHVERVVGIDPSRELLSLARARTKRLPFEVELHCAVGETLPFADASFDTVLSTYTLCSVADPLQTLREIQRVLRPGGRLVFIEHGSSPDARPRKWQRRLTPMWKRVSGNCHLDRDIVAELGASRFALCEVDAGYSPGPNWLTFTTSGIALPGD